MKTAVMFAIRPTFCRQIMDGSKKMEVRLSRPKSEPPFKCYIYRTQKGLKPGELPGVIGEFICNKIIIFDVPYPAIQNKLDSNILKLSCLSYYQLHRYAYHDPLYGIHISDFKAYSKPKPITDFRGICPNDLYCESCAMYNNYREQCESGALYKKRPPQSWYYVEELEN